MMLRAMHMTERHSHHFLKDRSRIVGCFCHAQSCDGVEPFRMTGIADIMPMNTSCFAVFLFMTDCALHENIRVQIFQRRFADQAFIFHNTFLSFRAKTCITAARSSLSADVFQVVPLSSAVFFFPAVSPSSRKPSPSAHKEAAPPASDPGGSTHLPASPA